jgi:acid phosphatase type 7
MIKSDGSTDAFLALGDLQYEKGESANFSAYYDAGLGRQQKFNDGRSVFDVTIPAVGNHEYLTPGAAGYFGYFREKAGDPAKGYFSRDLGKWRVVSVNTNCSQAGGCASTSPQGLWLVSELDGARKAGDSVVVIAHHPAFSDGSNYAPGVASAQMIFKMALDGGADVFLSGHDHQYQRFGPLIQDGSRHPAGLTYWVVGTGGKGNTGFNPSYSRTLSRWGQSGSLPGALRLTLRGDGSFGFQFKTTDGVIRDSGSGTSRS